MGASTTLYRRSIVTFDDFRAGVIQPYLAITRPHASIGFGDAALRENVQYVPFIGWQMLAHQSSQGPVHERSDAQGGILSVTAGKMTVAPMHLEANTFRQSGLSGVSYSGSPATGSPMIRKQVESGGSFDQKLTADQTAFPGPSEGDGITDIDRVAVSVDQHKPGETVGFRFVVGGASMARATLVARLYFTGPSGVNDALVGNGQYCVSVYGDGRALLWERGVVPGDDDLVWRRRFEFRFDNSFTDRSVGFLTVHSDARGAESSYSGSRIVFRTSDARMVGTGGAVVNLLAASAAAAIRDENKLWPVYQVPRVSNTTAVTLAPIRVDVRRDVRASFQVAKHTYPAVGTLRDLPFVLPFHPIGNEPIRFAWWGLVPSGATLEARIFNATTGDELATTLIVSDEVGGALDFIPDAGERSYAAQFDFGSDGPSTATLVSFSAKRPALIDMPVTDPWEADVQEATPALPTRMVAEQVMITGPSNDPAAEGAAFTLVDLKGDASTLRIRSGMPVRIETEYDELGQTTTLFEGYVESADATWKPTPTWPNRRTYRIACVGEWRRFSDAIAPQRLVFYDEEAKQPWKVTSVARECLYAAGYTDSEIDIPDLPLRLFSSNQDEYTLEPGASLADTAMSYLRDYLGAWLVWDRNAGATGMWRMRQPQGAPYRILTRFTPEHPGDGKLANRLGAHGVVELGGQDVPVVQIFDRIEEKAIRPEGNCVCVIGAATSGDESDGHPQQLSQILYNVRSYNFLGLAPEHDNYPSPTNPADNGEFLGYYLPIRVLDPTLGSQRAVDWVCRRVYQYACFSRREMRFTAPLVLVTDESDALQSSPRPLRFYDAVEFWNGSEWETWLVLSCNPSYRKDGHQMAQYTLVRSSQILGFLNGPPATPFLRDFLYPLLRAQEREIGVGRRTPQAKSAQRAMSTAHNVWMGWPGKPGAAIQDLDPESPTFGELLWTLDFSPLG